MKVILIGANGQLGSDLVAVLGKEHEVVGLTHHDVEITDIDNVNEVFTSLKPDLVINTAAYHVVPEAEHNPDRAFLINATGVLNLSRVTHTLGSRLLHFSTDYVFDGEKGTPYTETDCPNPLNVYGNSKLAGEYFALNYSEQAYVVRVSGIYGAIPSRAKGGNFVSTMFRLAAEKPEVKVVDDEVLTPTWTLEIAKSTAELIKTDAFGLYHLSAGGAVSWYEFARTIWKEMGLSTPLHAVKVSDFPSVVKRPFYSVLDNSKINSIGVNSMSGWQDQLVRFLATMKVRTS